MKAKVAIEILNKILGWGLLRQDEKEAIRKGKSAIQKLEKEKAKRHSGKSI